MASTQQRQLQALDVLLNHPEEASDPKLVCKMLQVCHGWNGLVQQSAGGFTCIKVLRNRRDSMPDTHERKVLKLAALAEWLKGHPNLVGSISVGFVTACDPLRPILRLTLGSLQYVAKIALHEGVAWRLRSFSSQVPVSSKVLTALPIASLTSLELSGIDPRISLGEAVAQLTQLRCLSLSFRVQDFEPPTAEMVKPLAALTLLTRLSLLSISTDTDVAQLSQQLQYLTLCYQIFDQPCGPNIDLQLLTALQSLKLQNSEPEPVVAHLPAQLHHLTLLEPGADYCEVQKFGIAGLHRLQQLYLQVTDKECLDLLAGHQQLRHLTVCSGGGDFGTSALIQSRSVFGQLPELNELGLDFLATEHSQLWMLVQCISQLTGMTSLSLHVDLPFWSRAESATVIDPPPSSVWNMLAGLSSLIELKVDAYDCDKRGGIFTTDTVCTGVNNLMQLTALTCLVLIGEWSRCFKSADLVQVMPALAFLKVLHVGDAENAKVWNITPLVNIGRLAHLRFLWYCYDRPSCLLSSLEYWHHHMNGEKAGMHAWGDIGAQSCGLAQADAKQGLLHLTGLSRLTELRGFANAGPKALEEFWAQIRYRRV